MLPDARGRRSICGAQTPGAHKRNSEAVAQKERRCVPALPANVRLNPDGVEGLFVTLPLVTSDRGPFVLPQGTDRQADCSHHWMPKAVGRRQLFLWPQDVKQSLKRPAAVACRILFMGCDFCVGATSIGE